MTPADRFYFSSTSGAVLELLSFAKNEGPSSGSFLVAKEGDDAVHHLTIKKSQANSQVQQLTKQILARLQQTIEKASKEDIKQALRLLNKDVEAEWEGFKAAKKVLNAYMKQFSLPEIRLKSAESQTSSYVYSSVEEAESALQYVFSRLGRRSDATYAISQAGQENECQLHILAHDGTIASYRFEIVAVGLVHNGVHYSDIGYFLNELQVNQIYGRLAGMSPGTYCTAKIAEKNFLYVVLPSGTTQRYAYTFENVAHPVFIHQKGCFNSVEELIKANFPELAVVLKSENAQIDASRDPVGTFCETGKDFTAHVSVVIGKNNLATLTYTADMRPEQFCVIQGTSYKSIQSFVQEVTKWRLRDVKIAVSDYRVSSAYPNLMQDMIVGQLSEQPPGTFCIHEGTLYVVFSKDEVKRYKDIAAPVDFVESFTPRLEQLSVIVRPFHPIQATHIQIETLDAFRNSYCVSCDEKMEIPLLRCIEGISPLPFFLRPVVSGQIGDFTLVAGLQRSHKGTILPIWQENIEILPDGKIAHISHKTKGTYGRVFDSFSQMKEWWGLGLFIYDTYAATESSCQTAEEVAIAFQAAPARCFLLWKTEGNFFVTVRKALDADPITYPLPYHQGEFWMESGAHRDKITGELIQALERIFDVPSFRAASMLQEVVSPYVETRSAHDERARFQKYASHGKLFTIQQEADIYLLTCFEPQAGLWHYIYNPTITRQKVDVRANGEVRLENGRTFDSVRHFKNFLKAMRSVKLLEGGSAEMIPNDAEELITESAALAIRPPTEDIQRKVREHCESVLGHPNFYNITRSEALNNFVALQAFFGSARVLRGWILLPASPTKATHFSPAKTPDVTNCEVVLLDDQCMATFQSLGIDRDTGNFVVGAGLFDSLEEALRCLAVDVTRAYTTLHQEREACQAQEKQFLAHDTAVQIDESHFEVSGETVATRLHPGLLTGSDGTTYKDIEDLVSSLQYVAEVPIEKRSVPPKAKPKPSAQIDIEKDERYMELGVGEHDLTSETRLKRLVIWLDELKEADDRCTKLEAKVILKWIGTKESITEFAQKSLKNMRLPIAASHLRKADVQALLETFLKTARGVGV